MRTHSPHKPLWFFLLFLPLFAPVAYVALLFHIGKRARKLSFKKIKNMFTDEFLPFNLLLLWLFVSVLVSALLSPYRKISLSVFPLLCFYLVAHFIIREATKREGGERFLNSIFLSVFFLCAFGVIQYLTDLNVDRGILIFDLYFSTRGGIGSTLGRKNRFAAYLILTLPLILTSIPWRANHKKRQFFLLALFSAGIIFLLSTGSLGAIGAMGIVMVIYLLIKNWKAGIVLLGAGGVVYLFLQSGLQGCFATLVEKYSAPDIRIYTWEKVCAPLIKEHPLLGTGLATYNKVASQYSSNSLTSHAHNLYLNYLGEIGILGTSFLLFSIGLFVRYMIELFRKASSPVSSLSLGFALSIVGLLIFGMIETVLHVFQLGLLLWSLMGIGLGIYFREKKRNNLKEVKNGRGAA